MAKVNWTPQALADIEEIADYIAKDSEYYAKITITNIFDAVKKLKEFPLSGRIVPELNRKDVREIIFGNYRIMYRLKNYSVEILTVYHSARLLGDDILDK